MKGIVLAGGTGSRLQPMTMVTNKHLLPIYDKPMCFHVIEYMREAGITDVMLIVGRESCGDFMRLLGSGKDLGVDLTFKIQEDADGIAGALRLCQDFANNEPVAVILGDNLLENGIKSLVDRFKQRLEMLKDEDVAVGAQIAVIEVQDPCRFGVASLDSRGKVEKIVEKPKHPDSNLAVIGVYMYDKYVWEVLPRLEPSARGEYEITDVNNAYIDADRLYCEQIKGWWTDAGTIDSMYDATLLMRSKAKGENR